MITNKTTFLQFIKQHIVENVSMKHLRFCSHWKLKDGTHFNVSLHFDDDICYHIMLASYRNGNICCHIKKYVDDGYDKQIIKQGSIRVDNNGCIIYDSFHFDDIFIKSKQ